MNFVNSISRRLLHEASPDNIFDCLVVGAGPAGLTAGIYLGRYRRKFLVVDGGESRASWIPTSRNFPAWPQGIHGYHLLHLMREQAIEWGTTIGAGRATNAKKDNDVFSVELNGRIVKARTLLIATGIRNYSPSCIDEPTRKLGTEKRLIKYCPICDPPDSNENIAIIGADAHATREALFMGTYTHNITLIPVSRNSLSAEDKRILDQKGMMYIDAHITGVRLGSGQITVLTSDGLSRVFDSIYPSLGSKIFNELLVDLGADLDPTGCCIVDNHCKTNIKGLYAAGDITVGLDQIDVASGQASIAATDMHNFLRTLDDPLPDSKLTVPIKGAQIDH